MESLKRWKHSPRSATETGGCRARTVQSKADLLDAVWGTRFVSKSALTTAVAELREALEDDAREPRYLQTVPKRGYRLVASVVPADPAPPSPGADSPAAAIVPALVLPAAPSGIDEETGTEPSDDGPTAITGGAPEAMPHRRRRWPVAAATAALIAGGLTAWGWWPRPTPSADRPASGRSLRLTVDLPHGVLLLADTAPRLALSPDGTRMVYAARTGPRSLLYLRSLDQFGATPIDGTDEASGPFFSPDGSRLGFFAGGELRTVPGGGGATTAVCQARVPLGASWTRDGTIVFSGAHGLGLFTVPAAGGQPQSLTTLDRKRGELDARGDAPAHRRGRTAGAVEP